MTLEQFKSLKIGDKIKFENGDVYTLTLHKRNDEFRHYEPNEVIYPDGHYFTFGEILILVSFKNNSDYITITKNGINSIIPYFSFLTNIIHIENHNSKKEQIEEQIKTLQDKLKEIEKNEVLKIAKTLNDGDFVEIVWHDGRSAFLKVFGITETQIGQYFDFNSDTKLDWYIPFNSISKLIIRKDIKEAHEKLTSLLKPTH